MEEQRIPGDGVVTGWGTINGRVVYVFSKDFTVFGGSLSGAHAEKIVQGPGQAHDERRARSSACSTPAARASRRASRRSPAMPTSSCENILASGVIPQISVIMGPCAGGDVYSPAMTDFIFMVKDTSYMYVTGPDVVKTVTNEVVTHEELGGARVHAAKSGVADGAFENDLEALTQMRRLIDFLPLSNREKPPTRPTASTTPTRDEPSLDTPGPGQSEQALRHEGADPEGRRRRRLLRDRHGLRQEHRHRLRPPRRHDRRLRRQPAAWSLAGVLDIDASRKAARFVRFCDAFNIPIVTFVDVPGFMPGTKQEYGGLIKHGAKLLFAYAEATVPKVTVITRKAYGGAYDVMSSKHLRGDVNYAWPTAEIAVMGAKGAVEIIFRADIGDPEKIAARTKEYQDRFANPFVAASRGYIDDVIMPHDTRKRHHPRADAR